MQREQAEVMHLDRSQRASINVIGTLQILEAARRHGERKVVFSSSAAISGELTSLPIRDGRDSLADVGAARAMLDYQPTVSLDEGPREYLACASTAF